MALVFVALNSVVQMILIPVYARLLIGNVSFDVWVVAESVVLYLGLPLILGVLTRYLVTRRGGEAAMDRLKPGLTALSILGLLFTLIVMFALKGDLILQRPGIVVEMAIPMILFFVIMFFVVLFVGWRLHFAYPDAVAVAFSATGRDFEIAIAIAITAFSPTVALATVVGPLIEVPVMLFLVWAAMRLGPALVRREARRGGPGRRSNDPTGGRAVMTTRTELPMLPGAAAGDPGAGRRRRRGRPRRSSAIQSGPASSRSCGTGPHCVCEMAAATRRAPEQRQQPPRASCAEAGLVRASRHMVDARWVYYERDDEACATAVEALEGLLG